MAAFGSILRQKAHGGSLGTTGTGVLAPLVSPWMSGLSTQNPTLTFLTSFLSGFLLSSALVNEMTPYLR